MAKNNDIIAQNRIFAFITAFIAAILLIPLIAMQFNTGVDWTIKDFLAAGVLLLSISTLFVLTARRIRRNSGRVVAGLVFGLILLWLWAELAVGIFTSWGN